MPKAFIEEYLRYFSDDQFEDPEKLYAAYEKEIVHSAYKRLSPEKFEQLFGVFWDLLRLEIKHSDILRPQERDRILYQLDAYVSSHEADEIIARYCEHQIGALENTFKQNLSEGEDHPEDFWYVPNNIDCLLEDGMEKWEPVKSLADEIIHQKQESRVLIGSAGVGKTLFMRHLEIACLKAHIFGFYLHTADIESATGAFLKDKIETRLTQLKALNLSTLKMQGLLTHLLREKKILFIIDAYDQVDQRQTKTLHRFMQETIADAPVIISTRPHRLKTLNEKLRPLQPYEVKPFDQGQLAQYFGDRFPIKTLLKQVPEDLLSVPLLAKLVKSLALDGKIEQIKGKAALFEQFTEHLMAKQLKNDQRAGLERDEYFYDSLLDQLSELSLLLKGEKQYFDKRHAKPFYGHLGAMEKSELLIGLVKHVLDIESKTDLEVPSALSEGKTHKYHHANFQEYFAARQLLTLYKEKKHDELFSTLDQLTYDQQELGLFFSELIALKAHNPEKDIIFWHDTLLEESQSDWVRTYALQIRDTLALKHQSARTWLDQLFREEEAQNIQSAKDPEGKWLRIPKGTFIYGSYEYQYEWPVKLVEVNEAYMMDKFPVTNQDFCDFLNQEVPDQDRLEKWIDLQGIFRKKIEGKIREARCQIFKEGDRYRVRECYGGHLVIHVSWYGAKAYSNANGLDLPMEAQWEKATRGRYGRQYPGEIPLRKRSAIPPNLGMRRFSRSITTAP